MKIKIAFTGDEEKEAAAALAALLDAFPGAKVRERDNHPPFYHTYLTTKMPGKPCNSKKNG